MAGIQIHWADFEAGQEPQNTADDDYATSFDVEFTLRGRALARMLGKQMRVLDRAVDKLDSASAIRALKRSGRTLDEVAKAASKEIRGAMEDHAYEIGAQGVTVSVIEPHVDSNYWEATVDKRKGEIKYLVQISVLGDWDPTGRNRFASDSTSLAARRLASRWVGLRQAIHVRRSDDIARTILDQMGGIRRLSAMIGAKNFISGQKDGGALGGVSFRFPRPGRGKPNFVKILLMPDDTYTVEFGSVHGYNYKKKKRVEGVYADQLDDVFERTTGLYLRL